MTSCIVDILDYLCFHHKLNQYPFNTRPFPSFCPSRPEHRHKDNSGVGGGENLILPFDDNSVEEHDISHDIVKQRLITHFKWANNRDEVVWATRNGSVTKYIVRSER
jgi:hypothetical protein